jgi:hypothetical protein
MGPLSLSRLADGLRRGRLLAPPARFRRRIVWTSLAKLATLALAASLATLEADRDAIAADYYLATDVPAALGSTTYTPNQILLHTSSAYSLETSLAAGFTAGALHRRNDGLWLASPAHPISLGGTEFEPRDVFSWDGASGFAMILDGSAAGIPADTRIDALFLGSAGQIVLSFDVPTRLGSVEYSRSDLVAYAGGVFSLYWSGAGAGVPAASNLVGAALDSAGVLAVTFDIPTTLSASEYLPGELAGWTGGSWYHYDTPSGWPRYAQLRDFAFVPSPGGVPDGSSLPGIPLTVAPAAGSDITLTWGSACSAGASDYEIYEGTMGSYYSHAAVFCSTGGLTSKTITPAAGNRYYLVVPRNGIREGSYGSASSGLPRPQGSGACLVQEAAACP